MRGSSDIQCLSAIECHYSRAYSPPPDKLLDRSLVIVTQTLAVSQTLRRSVE